MEGSVYLKARQEWDERYADLVLGKRNWQITAAGMMAITLVLAFGMVWVSTRSKFVPYVVEVDKLGYAIGAPNALTENTTRISTDRDGAVRARGFHPQRPRSDHRSGCRAPADRAGLQSCSRTGLQISRELLSQERFGT